MDNTYLLQESFHNKLITKCPVPPQPPVSSCPPMENLPKGYRGAWRAKQTDPLVTDPKIWNYNRRTILIFAMAPLSSTYATNLTQKRNWFNLFGSSRLKQPEATNGHFALLEAVDVCETCPREDQPLIPLSQRGLLLG